MPAEWYKRFATLGACTQIIEDYTEAVAGCACNGLCVSTGFKIAAALSCTSACIAGIASEFIEMPRIKSYLTIACASSIASREVCVRCSPPIGKVVPLQLAHVVVIGMFDFFKDVRLAEENCLSFPDND